MASPHAESQTVSPLPDLGYHPALSGPDLAIGQAITAVQAQCTAQINQLQTCQRLLEARLEQMSDTMSHMLLMLQPQQEQRRPGRPHPGKSMRAKKRKQAQARLEQANFCSECTSDADGLSAAAGPAQAPAAAVAPTSAATPPLGASAEAPVAATLGSEAAQAAPAPDSSASVDVTTPASPVAAHLEPGHMDEGWVDVASQAAASSSSVPALEAVEANKAMVNASAEEACGKLLEALKQQHAEQAASAQQAFRDQLAAFKEEWLQQLRLEQQRGIEALLEEQRKEASNILSVLRSSLATLRREQQSDSDQLGHELQEVWQKNEDLRADSACQIRSIADEMTALKLEFATATAAASITATPRTEPSCRVMACYWEQAPDTTWQLRSEREVAEQSLAAALTLSDLKVEAARALCGSRWNHFYGNYKELKDFSGSQTLPQEETLLSLNCSVLKVHFRYRVGVCCWWSYEAVSC